MGEKTKNMIHVHTKKIKKKWFCFSTFDGYDYSYTGSTKEQVQEKMRKRLIKSDLLEHAKFLPEEEIQPPPQEKVTSDFHRNLRIDNNPIA